MGIWSEFNNDLIKFVGIFYAATFALLLRVLVGIDHVNASITFAFEIYPETVALLFLVLWDYMASSFLIRVVPYRPPAYLEFVIHVAQVIMLAFAVSFSLRPYTDPPKQVIWETAYFWVAVYCASMIVWNLLYFFRHGFVEKFFNQLGIDAKYKPVFKIIASVKGFFLPSVVLVTIALFNFPVWPSALPGFEWVIIVYASIRVLSEMLMMHLFWSAQSPQPEEQQKK